MALTLTRRIRRLPAGISFRERNPVTIGIAGTAGLAVLLLTLFNSHAILVSLRSYDLQAVFSEAGGLKPGDDVRLVGRPVGSVTSVGLDHATVVVEMKVDKGIELGTATRAQVKTATALGVKYVALLPEGGGTLRSGARIPLSRTKSAYDITQALSQLTVTANGVDSKQLADALGEIDTTFKDTPDQYARALDGVQGLSEAIAKRDAKVREVFRRSAALSTVLVQRKTEIQKLLVHGDQLATELTLQRVALQQMISNLSTLAEQLDLLVKDGNTKLRPALVELNATLKVLLHNKAKLQSLITNLPPSARALGESVGNGPFYTAYLGNLYSLGFPDQEQ